MHFILKLYLKNIKLLFFFLWHHTRGSISITAFPSILFIYKQQLYFKKGDGEQSLLHLPFTTLLYLTEVNLKTNLFLKLVRRLRILSSPALLYSSFPALLYFLRLLPCWGAG